MQKGMERPIRLKSKTSGGYPYGGGKVSTEEKSPGGRSITLAGGSQIYSVIFELAGKVEPTVGFEPITC